MNGIANSMNRLLRNRDASPQAYGAAAMAAASRQLNCSEGEAYVCGNFQ